ncbi:MAG: glycosyltransferase family 4 protein, partial [Coprobacter sp.]|nr:glycosyltransferase family 4 protein [Coprobacter sp.]
DTPIIVLSELERKAIVERYNVRNVSVLPNCVDIKEELPIKERKKDTPLTIGYMGRITKEKGMEFLLEACKSLRSDNICFKLMMAGKEDIQDEFIPRFKEILGSDFIYAGVVSGKKKDEFINKLDLFILPSFFEGLPMSLLECMAQGVVPVTTNVGSISDVVIDSKNGQFIEVKNSISIYNAISELNRDREKITELSQEAYQTIKSNFSPEEYVLQLNNIYNKA